MPKFIFLTNFTLCGTLFQFSGAHFDVLHSISFCFTIFRVYVLYFDLSLRNRAVLLTCNIQFNFTSIHITPCSFGLFPLTHVHTVLICFAPFTCFYHLLSLVVLQRSSSCYGHFHFTVLCYSMTILIETIAQLVAQEPMLSYRYIKWNSRYLTF